MFCLIKIFWREKYLESALFVYNTTVHSTTGFTPFHALRGFPHSLEQIEGANSVEERLKIHATMTSMIHQKITENTQKAARRNENYKNRNTKVIEYQVGDKVGFYYRSEYLNEICYVFIKLLSDCLYHRFLRC